MAVVLQPVFVGGQIGRAIPIVRAVNGTAAVSMKPRSVGTKRNEVSKRRFRVIPHEDEDRRVNAGEVV